MQIVIMVGVLVNSKDDSLAPRQVWCEEFGAGLFFPSAVELDAGSQLHTVAEISVKDDGNLCVLQPDGAGREDKVHHDFKQIHKFS